MTIHKADIDEAHEVASLVQARREALAIVYLSRIAEALERQADMAERSDERTRKAMAPFFTEAEGIPLAAPMCEPGCPQLVTYEHTPDACFRPKSPAK